MSEQRHTTSSHSSNLPWWIRFFRWLWKLAGFLGTAVILALIVNVASTWLTTPNGILPSDTPLSFLLTHWPISLSVGCGLLILALVSGIISRRSVSSSTDIMTLQDRKHMIRRLRMRYTQMLAQSLQGVVEMELGLAERPAAVHNAANFALRLPEQAEQVLSPHTSIVDAYHLAQQELLILGAPGAGKSTQLLELARSLVEQAEQDTEQPLPVLLPLSSWANKRSPLKEWLIEQCALIYDIPYKPGLQLLPLFDGLDEMNEDARPDCIAAINTYHRDHLHPLVVCSRIIEYDSAAKYERLALHTAVVVQPLSPEQVDAYLVALGKPLTALRTALRMQPTLAELATTPLMLQILILTYHGTTVRQLSQRETTLQQQIWADYVQRMVERKGNAQHYPFDRVTPWLCWLARYMHECNQTIFSLEDLRTAFLPKKYNSHWRWSFGLISGLSFGGPLGALVGMLSFGTLGSGLFIGLLGALSCALVLEYEYYKYYKEVSNLKLALETSRTRTGQLLGAQLGALSGWYLFGFVGVLVGGPLGVLLSVLLSNLISKLDDEGLNGCLVALLGSLLFLILLPIGLLTQQPVPQLSVALGALASILFMVVGMLLMSILWAVFEEGVTDTMFVIMLLGSLLGALSFWHLFGLMGIVIGGIVGLLIIGPLASLLVYWLDTVVNDALVRIFLWHARLFPLRAISFLEDATARNFLRREGTAGYSFTHRLLLEYFADLNTTPLVPPAQDSPQP